MAVARGEPVADKVLKKKQIIFSPQPFAQTARFVIIIETASRGLLPLHSF